MKTDTSNKNALGYTESNNALNIRIETHKKYSNFSLEKWIGENIPLAAGQVVLDIGCGNGNLFPVYNTMMQKQGIIIGIDQSLELLASARAVDTDVAKVLLQLDLNNRFPFLPDTFDHIISTFSIYYANDPALTLQEIHRTLKPKGNCYLIGPTDRNASELYEYNQLVFGWGREDKVTQRTNRLEKVFFPAANQLFAKAEKQIIPCKLVFPSESEFLRYYQATLLFEESLKKSGKNVAELELPKNPSLTKEISKEMIVLWLTK